MIKNPEMRTRLYKMFEQTGEDTLKVRLAGNNTVPVEFDLKNIANLNITENAKAVGKYKADPVNRNIGFTGGHVYSSQQGRLFNPWNTIESLPYPINEVPTPYAIYV